jgi:hypothetical protein
MGKYLDIIRKAEETYKPVDGGLFSSTPPRAVLSPGNSITWEAEGKQRGPAIVDFIHVSDDGSQWAFVTLLDGWAAVNSRYVLTIKEGNYSSQVPSDKRPAKEQGRHS